MLVKNKNSLRLISELDFSLEFQRVEDLLEVKTRSLPFNCIGFYRRLVKFKESVIIDQDHTFDVLKSRTWGVAAKWPPPKVPIYLQ